MSKGVSSKDVSKIYRALVIGERVSLAVLDTTALVNEAITRHKLSPVAAAALGRSMTATAYLASWLKEESSSLSFLVDGGGAGGKIGVAADGALNLRGYIEHPDIELPARADGKLDVGGCVGRRGTLTVIRDDGEGIPFVGTSELVSGEIAEDVSAYFLTSEQRPTAIALGVKIGQDGRCLGAGGLFLQPLPFAGDAAIDFVQEKISHYSALSSIIEDSGAQGVLSDFDLKDVTEREVAFLCHCSRERAESALLSMGKEDALALLSEQGKIVVHCHYCNTDHIFDERDVRALFGEKS